MSDPNESNQPLESLQQMLEAEMRGADPKEDKPTAARAAEKEPTADDLGGLLGDLLTEAQKEVSRDRPAGTGPSQQGAALSHGSPSSREVAAAATLDELARAIERPAPKASPGRSKAPLLAAAAALIVGAGLFAMGPSEAMTLPNIAERAQETVTKASLQWQTLEAKREASEAKAKVAQAEAKTEEAQAAAKVAQAEAKAAEEAKEVAEAKSAQDAMAAEEALAAQATADPGAKAVASKKKPSGSKRAAKGKRRGKRRGKGKKLRIKTNVF